MYLFLKSDIWRKLKGHKNMARVTKDYEMTIAPELFEAWQKSRRKGDPDEIAGILNKSRPVIDKALKYGFVKDQTVVNGITKFYNDRLSAERKDGMDLLKKSTKAK